MTKAKFKVTADMVDAAYYGVECDLSWDEMKKIIQLAADQWLQTKGGGYVSLGDYNNVCESYALLHEEHGELFNELTELKEEHDKAFSVIIEDYNSLSKEYKDLESDYEALTDELVEIKGELEKRGFKL